MGLVLCGIWGCGDRIGSRARPAGVAKGGGDVAAEHPSGRNAQEVQRIVSEPNEIITQLHNGMIVIARRVPTPAISVRGYVMAGGIYEGRWLGGGLSHLLEHLVAGGTNGRRSESQNRDLLQQIGNNSNAYTTWDHTCYFVNTTPENLDKAADLVTGWMLTAKITPEEYRREYEVVQRELEMGEGDPERVFFQQAVRNRYLVSPTRVPVIGYQSVIQGLSRDDVYEYYRLAYQPNNMVFAVAGDLPPDRILDAVKRNVAMFNPGRTFNHDIPEEPPVLAPRISVATFPKLGQAKLQLGFPTIRLSDPDLYALDLLATVLGKGESAILVQELRDGGLASAVSVSSYTPQFVEGMFWIDMELAPDKLADATAAAMAQIERIKREGVSEERLRRARVQTRTARAFSQQTAEEIAGSLATDFISTGDAHFSDRYVERMQAVTGEQIRAVANKYLDTGRLLTTAMLPEEAVGSDGLAAAERTLRRAAPTARPGPEAAPSKIVKATLGDGTILLVKRLNAAPIVVMNLYSLGGLTAEDAESNGLGNLAMRLATRGTTDRSARQIAEFFDSIGGELSATCGNNTWGWGAVCLKDDFGKAMGVFADVVKNPAFAESEVATMKQRIMAAIESQDADWFNQSYRFFRKSYFGPEQSPYQFLAIGTKENVGRFTADDVRAWYREKVLPSRRVLAVFGDVDIEQAKSLAGRHFGGVAQGQGAETPSPEPSRWWRGQRPADEDVPRIRIERVEVNPTRNPEAGVMIGFKSQSVVGNAANDPLAVADTMTSGYGFPTGYIFETLRGKGLVYDANAINFPGRNEKTPGVFFAYAGCDPKNVNEVVNDILMNIARLQGGDAAMSRDWFDRSKKLVVTAEALNNQTPAEQSQTAALDELFGLGYGFHLQFADRIDAVGLADVSVVARRLLSECVVTINTSEPNEVAIKAGIRVYDRFPPVDLTPRGVGHDAGGPGR